MIESAANPRLQGMGSQQLSPGGRTGLDSRKVLDLCSADFVRAKSNVVVPGPIGVGKTSLALTLAKVACDAGFSICFTIFDDVVHRLRTAEAAGRRDEQLKAYLRPAESRRQPLGPTGSSAVASQCRIVGLRHCTESDVAGTGAESLRALWQTRMTRCFA